MPKALVRETLEYAPRDLAFMYQPVEEGGNRFYFSAIRAILGNALCRSRAVFERRLGQTQGYKRVHKRLLDEGRTYKPLFPWGDELLDESAIAGAFRSAVKKEEGVFTLVDVSPADAVKDMFVRGETLEASVKSKSNPGGKTPTYYIVTMESPYLGEGGEIKLRGQTCSCGDLVYDAEKRGSSAVMRCLHLYSGSDELDSRTRFPNPRRRVKRKGKQPNTGVFNPWAFSPNYYRNPGGIFVPRNNNLAALEYEALVALYMGDSKIDNQFGIDRRLYQLHEIYTGPMMDAIRRGEMRREVLGQRPVRRKKSRNELRAEKNVLAQMGRILRSFGYHPEGRCLELGDKVAIRYENGPNAVNIVFGEGPIFYTYREGIDRGPINPCGTFWGSDDPFSLLGAGALRGFDDRSMRDTKFRVELPSAMRLPERRRYIYLEVPQILKNRWRRAIRKSNRENPERKLKYARLFY